jgi:hypothetical protein
MFAYNSIAIGLKLKYFIRDSEGVRILGSTKMIKRTFDVYNLASRSAKLSKNFMLEM